MSPAELVRIIAIFGLYSMSGAILPLVIMLWFVNYGRVFLWLYRFISPLTALAVLYYSFHYTLTHLSLHASFMKNVHPLIGTGSVCLGYLMVWALTTFFHIGPPKWFIFLGDLQLQTLLKRRLERGDGDVWIQRYERRVDERRAWATKTFRMPFIKAERTPRSTNDYVQRPQPKRWNNNQTGHSSRSNVDPNMNRPPEQNNVDNAKSQSNQDFRNGRVGWHALGKQYRANPNALENIYGMDHVLKEVEYNIEMVVNNMNLMREYDAAMTAGILMYGPPGTGKTELARAVAEHLGLYFISVRPSDLLGTLVGATQQNIASLFKEAKDNAPSIIFFDEIDAIGAKRGTSHMYHDQTLTQLLMELDGFDRRDRVFVLAATNRIDILDEALVRDGRFGITLYVPTPDQDTIKFMFWKWSAVLDFDEGVYPIEVAMHLEGQTGAAIKGLVERLKRIAIEKRISGDHKALVTRKEVYAEIARITGTTT